LVYSFASRL
jgi:hypothetical protein